MSKCKMKKGSKSKRLTLRKQHKIVRKVADHKKKVRKEAKKMKALGIYKKTNKQEIGLPNLFPLKAEVIQSIQRKKKVEDNQRKIEKLKKNQKLKGLGGEDIEHGADRTQQFQDNYQEQDYDVDLQENNSTLREGKKYYGELKKVLQASDIILEVLDARDPIGCRCKEVEAEIMGMQGEKKIILVLNKIDLVPRTVADAWLKYLRREYATVLFKANTQKQNDHLSSVHLYKKSLTDRGLLTENLLESSAALGADSLLQLIKNYSKKDGVKQSVTVGLIGYPNVGKSSVINSLKKSKAAGVSSTPGFTKNMQEILLDQKVKLLDCPGIVFSSDGEKSLVLRNIIKVDQVQDPIAPLEEIVNRVQKRDLLLIYKIPDFSTPKEFLMTVAQSRGKLKKGGVTDLDATARVILNDWNAGKLKYYTTPPLFNDQISLHEGEEPQKTMDLE